MKHFSFILIFTTTILNAHNQLSTYLSSTKNQCSVIELDEIAVYLQEPATTVLKDLCASDKHITVIKFSSDRQCGACLMFAPVFAHAATDVPCVYKGEEIYPVIYISVEGMLFQDILKSHGISIMPTVLAYHNGKLIAANTRPYNSFEKFIVSLGKKLAENE